MRLYSLPVDDRKVNLDTVGDFANASTIYLLLREFITLSRRGPPHVRAISRYIKAQSFGAECSVLIILCMLLIMCSGF